MTLASTDIASKCQTSVTDKLLGSDHFIILTTINNRVIRSDPLPRKWSLNKADWKKFSRLVDLHLENSNSHNADTENLNSEITSSLIFASTNAIPRSKNTGKKPVPWWNPDCERAIRLKRAVFLKMKRSFDFEHVLLFKKRRSECRRILLSAKRQCWENFCASLNMRANAKKVWRVAR